MHDRYIDLSSLDLCLALFIVCMRVMEYLMEYLRLPTGCTESYGNRYDMLDRIMSSYDKLFP